MCATPQVLGWVVEPRIPGVCFAREFGQLRHGMELFYQGHLPGNTGVISRPDKEVRGISYEVRVPENIVKQGSVPMSS